MAQKSAAKTSIQSIPAGKKAAPRPRRQPRVRISAGTWIFILVLVAVFLVWNFVVLPRLGQTTETPSTPQVFQVAQHKDLDVVNAQLKTRHTFLAENASKPVPAQTGKTSPFE